jgi:hypothetical protein
VLQSWVAVALPGPPAHLVPKTSDWTVDTLKQYYDQRFIDQDRAVTAALNAAKEAVVKAETAANKRFEAQNEFRDQLRDQAATFMPRTEADIRFTNLAEQIANNTSNIDRSGGGASTSQRLVTNVLAAIAILMSAGAIIAIIITAH